MTTGRTPTSRKPSIELAAELGDERRIAREGAVADDVVAALDRYVEDRRAVDVDAEIAQLGGQQARIEAHRAARLGDRGARQRAERGGRRRLAPMRWLEARDPAALLVDQDRRAGPADRAAQLADQRAHLVGRLAIALEQDEAIGIGVAEKARLLGRQARAGAAIDHRPGSGRVRL